MVSNHLYFLSINIRPSENILSDGLIQTKSFFPFRPWVRLIINARQMVEIQLGINLRSGKITVSQQFLHGADIARCLQKMGGVAVAHHVRRDMAGAAHTHRPRL